MLKEVANRAKKIHAHTHQRTHTPRGFLSQRSCLLAPPLSERQEDKKQIHLLQWNTLQRQGREVHLL